MEWVISPAWPVSGRYCPPIVKSACDQPLPFRNVKYYCAANGTALRPCDFCAASFAVNIFLTIYGVRICALWHVLTKEGKTFGRAVYLSLGSDFTAYTIRMLIVLIGFSRGAGNSAQKT